MDDFSLSVAQLELFGAQAGKWVSCGHGTGFFYKPAETIYAVTNWHVVTGVDPTTTTAH